MANYDSNLKTWGSTGSIYPDGYSYLEDEQPVDAWDNFFNSNVIADLSHLISLTNDRLETDTGTAYPASPEIGHLSYRQDTETLHVWNDTNSEWHRLLKADGDQMSGVLDMGGNQIEDTTGTLTLVGEISIPSGDITDGANILYDAANQYIPAARVEQGPGSGLDADLFDGKDSTNFVSVNVGSEIPEIASTESVSSSISAGELVYVTDDGLYLEDGN